MSWVNEAKKRAATEAIKHVKDGMVIGLGSGSTALYAVQLLGEKLVNNELFDVKGVPTSYQISSKAIENGIQLTTLEEHAELDVGIDGADQIDRELNGIKGGGAALFREKIVASACNKYILIADERKFVDYLGDQYLIPLEVHPFAVNKVKKDVEELGANVKVRVGNDKLGPVITDNGNFILDTDFGRVSNLYKLDSKLRSIPGLIETGLFLGYADYAYIGTPESIRKLKKL